jgi:hypothetical protein
VTSSTATVVSFRRLLDGGFMATVISIRDQTRQVVGWVFAAV